MAPHPPDTPATEPDTLAAAAPWAHGAAYVRPLDLRGRIDLTHGAGGRATHQLVSELFLPAFAPAGAPPSGSGRHASPPGEDAAVLGADCSPPAGHRLVLSTDAHVVSPLCFPGGDIGRLGVHGSVNDLAMMGAQPLCLSVSFILEEGLPLADLQQVARSMGEAAREAGVRIASGDTKVVERGKADRLYLSVSALGHVAPGVTLSATQARPGDAILLSGRVGEHGLAVLSQRQGLQFDAPIASDTAALHRLVAAMLASGARLRLLRDPTRGGVATALNEIAASSGVGMVLEEAAVPLQPAVSAACELLGLDALYLANEGKLLAICAPDDADALLATMRAHPLGQDAARIGTVVADPHGFVQARTALGGVRLLDWLSGDPLPRIC